MNTERIPYPSAVTDAEWNLAAPYLTLMTEDAPQREYGLTEVPMPCTGWSRRAASGG